MATTTYAVFANGEQIATASKKSVAIEKARAARDENRVDVAVVTGAGTEVFALAAPKKIKMSAPYTREVAVDAENVEYINGKRVAYKRTRVGFALLDSGRGAYEIWDLERHVTMGEVEVATTREAGRWFADEARAIRASLVEA